METAGCGNGGHERKSSWSWFASFVAVVRQNYGVPVLTAADALARYTTCKVLRNFLNLDLGLHLAKLVHILHLTGSHVFHKRDDEAVSDTMLPA